MSGMTNAELVKLFKDNLEKFLDIMIQQFPSEKDFKIVQLGLRTNMILPDKALRGFAQVILPHKDMVLNRDENFFLEKCKDDKAVKEIGIEWAIQQSKELKAAGTPVLHYYTMGLAETTKKIASQVF